MRDRIGGGAAGNGGAGGIGIDALYDRAPMTITVNAGGEIKGGGSGGSGAGRKQG